jgi:putative heme transporter
VAVNEDSPAAREARPVVRRWNDTFGAFATRCLQALIVIAVGTLAVAAGLALKTVVISVLIALILGCAFSPMVRFLERRRIPSALAALITLLIVIGVLVGVLTLVGFAVAGQSSDIADAVSDGIVQLEDFLRAQFGITIDSSQIQSAVNAIGSYVTSASFGSSALSGLSAAGNFLTGLVLVVFILFFFLRDGRRIWEFLIRPFSGEAHARAERIGNSSAHVLGAYARGTATVAAVDAVFIGAGLLICGVPLALPLAVLVFVTAFIPVVGATLAGVIAALVALVFNGPVIALVVVGIVVLVNQLEGNLLQPVIMGRALSLHPLVILLALTAGTILGGIVGAILSVPTASVIWTAIKSWRAPEPEDDLPPDAVAASGHGS